MPRSSHIILPFCSFNSVTLLFLSYRLWWPLTSQTPQIHATLGSSNVYAIFAPRRFHKYFHCSEYICKFVNICKKKSSELISYVFFYVYGSRWLRKTERLFRQTCLFIKGKWLTHIRFSAFSNHWDTLPRHWFCPLLQRKDFKIQSSK